MGDLASVPPFGMSPVLPAFDRATRIAGALFGDVEASVVLVDGDRVWRSAGRYVGTSAPADGARFVIDNRKALWFDDLAAWRRRLAARAAAPAPQRSSAV